MPSYISNYDMRLMTHDMVHQHTWSDLTQTCIVTAALGGLCFSKSCRSRTRMIPDSREVEKQRKIEATKVVHARFDSGTLKSCKTKYVFQTRMPPLKGIALSL